MHALAQTRLFETFFFCLSEVRASSRANFLSMSCEVQWLITKSAK